MKNKLILAGIAFAAIMAMGFIFSSPEPVEYQLSINEMQAEVLRRNDGVKPTAVAQMVESGTDTVVFIDLRTPSDFLAAHLPNAVNIPTHTLYNQEFKALFADPNKTKILYHADHCGACAPWMLLKQLGYPKVKLALGGFNYLKPLVLDKDTAFRPTFYNEQAKYDYAKVVKETAGSSMAPSTSAAEPAAAPAPKRKKKKMEGGC